MSIEVVVLKTFRGTAYKSLRSQLDSSWLEGSTPCPNVIGMLSYEHIQLIGEKIRVGAFENGTMIGFAFGYIMSMGVFLHASSYVAPGFRKRGIYRSMHSRLIFEAADRGALWAWSRHKALNNPVLIAKLKFGYSIFEVSHAPDGSIDILLRAKLTDLFACQNGRSLK